MLYHILSNLFNILLRSFYTLEIRGFDDLPDTASIVAPNHASFLDPPLVSLAYPSHLHFFARKSLFQNKLFAYVLKKLNAHPIGPGAEGLRALAQARKLLNDNQTVVLFPEGTRSEDGALLPLKKGVVNLSFKSNVPITPMFIHGAHEVWPRGNILPRVGGKITLTFCKPLYPSSYAHLPTQEATEQMLTDLQNTLHGVSSRS
ncbi:MAG: lysophospholipid acyltransferase family protein [Chlamydiota bacterium]